MECTDWHRQELIGFCATYWRLGLLILLVDINAFVSPPGTCLSNYKDATTQKNYFQWFGRVNTFFSLFSKI